MKKKLFIVLLGLGVWLWMLKNRRWIQHNLWQPFYSRCASLYHSLDWLTLGWMARLRQPALNALPDPPARVLEAGTGSGHFHVKLAERYETAGLDLAPGMVEHTRQELSKHKLTADLRQGDITDIPWPGATFDAVVSTFVFSAIPNAQAAANEMARVVKPGGKVIIVDAGDALDGNPIAWLLARAWAAIGDYMRDERPYLEAAGLVNVARRDYGPGNSVHITQGTKPD